MVLARMHSAFIRPGGLSKDIPVGLLDDIYTFSTQLPSRLDEIEDLLSGNRIWRQRLAGVGVVSAVTALKASFSGVMLRASGIQWDLRKHQPYDNYSQLDLNVPVGFSGDCYDRYLLRLFEVRSSLSLVQQCLPRLSEGVAYTPNGLTAGTSSSARLSMEALIHHFKSTIGPHVLAGEVYSFVEAPKGEFGVYLVSSGKPTPYRCHIRAPGFFHLQGLCLMARHHMLADVVTIIGTQDVVFGEIDR